MRFLMLGVLTATVAGLIVGEWRKASSAAKNSYISDIRYDYRDSHHFNWKWLKITIKRQEFRISRASVIIQGELR